ncbi:DUF4817 domain-containing protein [Trichonephila clavipes]|nr:DUF4817 domain-containing protein [Trichonephila clavipes]
MDHVMLNHGQVTWTIPKLASPSPNYHTTPREDVSALDRFNVHRCPTRRVFSGTGLELVTRQTTVRYLFHSATAATAFDGKTPCGAYRRSYCTVERSIEEDPDESIRHRAQELDLCPSTVWKILRKDLGLRAYKIQLVQELKPNDHQARRRFVEWAQNEIAVVPDFHKRILFSDEVHFCLNGYVNKQN